MAIRDVVVDVLVFDDSELLFSIWKDLSKERHCKKLLIESLKKSLLPVATTTYSMPYSFPVLLNFASMM